MGSLREMLLHSAADGQVCASAALLPGAGRCTPTLTLRRDRSAACGHAAPALVATGLQPASTRPLHPVHPHSNYSYRWSSYACSRCAR